MSRLKTAHLVRRTDGHEMFFADKGAALAHARSGSALRAGRYAGKVRVPSSFPLIRRGRKPSARDLRWLRAVSKENRRRKRTRTRRRR